VRLLHMVLISKFDLRRIDFLKLQNCGFGVSLRTFLVGVFSIRHLSGWMDRGEIS
jgi:hypothetical protein